MFLEATCLFVSFLIELYETIIKRKLQQRKYIKIHPTPLDHYIFLYGINTVGVKYRFLLK